MGKLVLIFKICLASFFVNKWVLVFFTLCITFCAIAQDSTQAKHAVYLEIGGNAGRGCINYELNVIQAFKPLLNSLGQTKFQFNLRGGFAAIPLYDYTKTFNPDLILPVTVLCQYGNLHRIVMSFGTVFSSAVVVDVHHTQMRNNTFNASFYLAYRFQKKYTKGIMFQCMYAPLFYGIHFSKHWAGFGFGYAF